ncbi:MAG TPA: MFS transporter [Gaiellaceae bacterium]|nr:MFS transporter [Gaiellaceae bacterium]
MARDESLRPLLVLCSAIIVCDTMFFAALTPLLPEYAEEFGLSKAGAGALQAAYPLGVLVGSIPSGYVAARFGVKPTAVTALVVIAGTSVIFGYASSITALDLARFLQGVASAFAWTAALAWLIAVAPPGRRGQLIGTVLGVAIAGALFGPVLGGLASVLGTGPVFSAVGVLAVVVAVWALLTPTPPRGERQPISYLWGALHNTRIAGGLWLVALPALMFGTLTVLVPLRLSDLGFAAIAISVVFIVSAALEAGISPVVGRVADRRGKRYPITVGLVASAIALAILPWPQQGALLAAVTVLAACAFGIFWAPAMSLLTDTAERIGLEVAWGFALANLAWAPGQAMGAAAGGALARATADALPYLLLSGCCLVTLAVVRNA